MYEFLPVAFRLFFYAFDYLQHALSARGKVHTEAECVFGFVRKCEDGVREVMTVVESPVDASKPVHGATVRLSGVSNGLYQSFTLSDSTEVIDGDTASFYFTKVRIMPGATYSVSVEMDGYPPVTATATVPIGHVTIPDQSVYSAFRDPDSTMSSVDLKVTLSNLATAVFAQTLVEYRGIDSAGRFCVGTFNVMPIDSLNPFTEIEAGTLPVEVDMYQYSRAFHARPRIGVSYESVASVRRHNRDSNRRQPLQVLHDFDAFTRPAFNEDGQGHFHEYFR